LKQRRGEKTEIGEQLKRTRPGGVVGSDQKKGKKNEKVRLPERVRREKRSGKGATQKLGEKTLPWTKEVKGTGKKND